MIFVDAIIAGVVRQFPGFKRVLLTLIHAKWVTHRIADQTSLAKRVTHRIADRTSLKTSILHLLMLLYIQIIAPTKDLFQLGCLRIGALLLILSLVVYCNGITYVQLLIYSMKRFFFVCLFFFFFKQARPRAQ